MPPRILIAHADLRAGGGAEAFVQALADRLAARGLRPGWLDRHGHRAPDGTWTRPGLLRLSDLPGLGDKSLWAWALVCRALPGVAADYDGVILGYGDGPDPGRPHMVIRHAPVLFSDAPAALAHLGAPPCGAGLALRRGYARACARTARMMPRAGSGKTGRQLANSRWTAAQATALTGQRIGDVLYPPLPPAPAVPERAPAPRDPMALVALGRIVPNKRLDDAIAALDGLRARGWPVHLTLIGRAPGPAGRAILRRARAHSHVTVLTDADSATKAAVLARANIGLHLYRGEHFGIAVAEMIAAGVLPVVHGIGGVVELVPDPGLHIARAADLPDRVAALLTLSPTARAARLARLRSSPGLRGARAFSRQADAVLDRFIAGCSRC